MDVVLIKEIEKLGKAGAVVQVKPGFARNYLLPRGLAVTATDANLKTLRERTQQLEHKQARLRQQAEALKQRVEGLSLTLKLNVGEQETVFGSITAHAIHEALAAQGLGVDKHAIHLAEPIKTLGVFEIPVRLHPDVSAILKVWVAKA